MYVCSCFGVTEEQVKRHAQDGACTPRQIASACKAGTDCGSCVRRIQALLGRGACPRRELADQGRPVLTRLDQPRAAGAAATETAAAAETAEGAPTGATASGVADAA